MPESWATSPHARRSMQGNRSRDTVPEMAVRRLLHTAGFRYRVNARPDPGLRRTADLVFRSRRVAVFIDGCFWHGCPAHFRVPRSNVEYWSAKIQRNQERDQETTAELVARGWTVVRYWSHEDPSVVAEAIASAVGQPSARGDSPEALPGVNGVAHRNTR